MMKFVFIFVVAGLFTVGLEARSRDHCEPDEFLCEDGKQCIFLHEWCDAEEDCDDGSDEKYCALSIFGFKGHKCSQDKFFKCKNGRCIPKSGLCDGFDSCDDGSDETNCSDKKTTTAVPKFHDVQEMTSHTELHTQTGFLASPNPENMRIRARNWLLQQRDEDSGWGEDTHRAIIALQLSKKNFTDDVDSLFIKQMELNLAIDIARNHSKQIPLTELALYINAMLSTCKCPNNFHGYDLVKILRNRVDVAYNLSRFYARDPSHQKANQMTYLRVPQVYPFVILTLCINNVSHWADVGKLQELTTNANPLLDRIDVLSMGLIAMRCLLENPTFRKQRNDPVESVFNQIRQAISLKIHEHGFPGNIYEAATFYQALYQYPEEVELTEKAKKIIFNSQLSNGSFGDILSTYYVLPILSGQSLLSLPDSCHLPIHPENTPLEILKNLQTPKVRINFALEYGHPYQYSHTLEFHASAGTNMLDMMRLAEENNPNYRFKLDKSRDAPVIYSIGDIPNDVERGMYWCLYYKRPGQLEPSYMSNLTNAKHIILGDRDTLKYWYRPV